MIWLHMKFRKCNKCEEEQDERNFTFKNKAKGRRNTICGTCQRKYKLAYYYRNRRYEISRNMERRRGLSLWMEGIKSKLKCRSCPERHPACLDFHHKDLKQKEHGVSMMPHRGFSKRRILEEIKKCAVVCANCHRKIHYNDHKRSVS